MCQGCETERRRKTISRNFSQCDFNVPASCSYSCSARFWSTQEQRASSESQDMQLFRRELICEARHRFVLAHRDRDRGDGDRSVISFRRQRARIHDAASKPCDAQFHALRQLIWRLAVACGSRISSPGVGVAPGQRRVDADFPRHAVSHDAGGCGGNRD